MKLEDIKKKNIYSVPDKYFDRLPTRIQSRVNEKKPVFWLSLDWSLMYKVAAPVMAIVLIIFYISSSNNLQDRSAESLLAQVSTDDLIAYLNETDITTDEIIESIDFSGIDIDFSQDDPIIPDMELGNSEMEMLFDEYGLDEELL